MHHDPARSDAAPHGVRPDEPLPLDKPDPCKEYRGYVVYAQQLQETYLSRASQNRWWLYVAAILGLGAAAASGGLAAAGAAGVGTLGLLGISGGFAAGTFGTLDNAELAKMYTLSANSLDRALQKADARLKGVAQVQAAEAKRARLEKLVDKLTKEEADANDTAKKEVTRKLEAAKAALKEVEDQLKAATALADAVAAAKDDDIKRLCVQASVFLRAEITKTRTKLELLRTNNAAGALARAQEERKALDEIIKQFPPPSPGTSEESEEEAAPTAPPTN